MIIPLSFRCDQHCVCRGILLLENKDSEVANKNRMNVQMNDILSLILLSQDNTKSDEEEEGDLIMFK